MYLAHEVKDMPDQQQHLQPRAADLQVKPADLDTWYDIFDEMLPEKRTVFTHRESEGIQVPHEKLFDNVLS